MENFKDASQQLIWDWWQSLRHQCIKNLRRACKICEWKIVLTFVRLFFFFMRKFCKLIFLSWKICFWINLCEFSIQYHCRRLQVKAFVEKILWSFRRDVFKVIEMSTKAIKQSVLLNFWLNFLFSSYGGCAEMPQETYFFLWKCLKLSGNWWVSWNIHWFSFKSSNKWHLWQVWNWNY